MNLLRIGVTLAAALIFALTNASAEVTRVEKI